MYGWLGRREHRDRGSNSTNLFMLGSMAPSPGQTEFSQELVLTSAEMKGGNSVAHIIPVLKLSRLQQSSQGRKVNSCDNAEDLQNVARSRYQAGREH